MLDDRVSTDRRGTDTMGACLSIRTKYAETNN